MSFSQVFKSLTLIAALAEQLKEAKADGEVEISEVIELLVMGVAPILEVFGVDLTDEIQEVAKVLGSEAVKDDLQAKAQSFSAHLLE